MGSTTDLSSTAWANEAHESTPLAQRVAEQLREKIMSGQLQPEEQLPNEPELSALLNVSRSTVRSALTILEQGGFVLRRRGIGTFVARTPPTFNNLNVNSGVTQLIRSSGAEPGCVELLVVARPASDHVAGRLDVEPGSPVVAVERVRLANDRRTVFSLDHLPSSLFHTLDGEIPLARIQEFVSEHQSMYAFLRHVLNLDIHHGIARIRPLTADSYLAEKLQVRRGSGILHIEQVDYNAFGEPIALADEYFVADAFTFTVYRSS
jgi:GntR family transcriptional regulator